MKNKFLILFIEIISFLGLSVVKAETYNFNYSFSGVSSSSIKNYNFIKSFYVSDREIINKMYVDLYSYYEEKYKNAYPYYYIKISTSTNDVPNHKYQMDLVYFSYDSVYLTYDDPAASGYLSGRTLDSNYNQISLGTGTITYKYENSAYVSPFIETDSSSTSSPGYYFLSHDGSFETIFGFFYSNINFKYYSSNASDKLVINNYAFSGESKTINVGDNIPLLQEDMGLDIIKDSSLPSTSYTEINLNNYPYVVLSLNDYSVTDEFYSNMYVKGQYCVTPGYNYGLLSYDDVNSTRVQNICSQYYDQETMVRMYVTKDNLKNNSIYYIKAQDKTKDNIIKVDTSVFTIHYIYEDDKDNPIININGKNYSIIPFDELPSTANKNTDEGFVPGLSCQVGDFNCTTSNYYRSDSNLFDENGNLSFGSIFSSPLDLLKDIWSAIIKVFELISMLILLLPTPLQSFLFLSFMLAIILGIIKILL